jgi:hypothetical protein
MNKYLTTLGFIALTLSFSAQINVVFSENFNQGIPSTWNMIDADQGTPYADPTVSGLTGAFHCLENSDSTGIGDSIVAATSWFTDTVSANNFIISPLVQLGATGNYLYFDAKSTDASYPDGLQVRYTYNHINIDSIMASDVIFDTIAIPPTWTNFKVKLDTSLNGALINIAFRHYATDKFILELDNIRIETNDLTAIEHPSNESNKIYPNPCINQIFVEGIKKGDKYEIYHMNGILINTGYYDKNITFEFSSGMYLLKTESSVHKFVVK